MSPNGNVIIATLGVWVCVGVSSLRMMNVGKENYVTFLKRFFFFSTGVWKKKSSSMSLMIEMSLAGEKKTFLILRLKG